VNALAHHSSLIASNLSVGAKFNYADAPADVLERARGLQTVAARHRVSLKAAALQFALAHPQVTCIIPGTRHPDRVNENLKLVDEPISFEFWAELKAGNLIREDAPVPE
jgi:D-threo-aldose 1-dehydrogenase